MDYLFIITISFVSSLLTFYSGFGLGTIMLPTFAIWFPLDISIAMTAIVHFLNNSFKFFLTQKNISYSIAAKFGLPATLFALAGAQLFETIKHNNKIVSYSIFSKDFEAPVIKIIIAVTMIFFVLFETLSFFRNLQFSTKWIVLGGSLSGFFGGFSGHQGALRSAFLIKCQLSKESFIATGIAIACLVDIARLIVYADSIRKNIGQLQIYAIIAATGSAFLGAYIGNKMLKKVTMNSLQKIIGAGIILISILMILGKI